jgi:hypothetical protein
MEDDLQKKMEEHLRKNGRQPQEMKKMEGHLKKWKTTTQKSDTT